MCLSTATYLNALVQLAQVLALLLVYSHHIIFQLVQGPCPLIEYVDEAFDECDVVAVLRVHGSGCQEQNGNEVSQPEVIHSPSRQAIRTQPDVVGACTKCGVRERPENIQLSRETFTGTQNIP